MKKSDPKTLLTPEDILVGLLSLICFPFVCIYYLWIGLMMVVVFFGTFIYSILDYLCRFVNYVYNLRK